MLTTKLRMAAVAALLAGTLALGGCAKKRVAAAPVTPPPAPAAPTATLTATPGTVEQGQAVQLSWTTQNATDVTIDALGAVAATGNKAVTPNSSTTYTLTAKGPGGTKDVSARVTVNPKVAVVTPPPASLEELFKQNVHDVYFDYDRYDLRATDQQAIATAAKFLQDHPNAKLVIEGHCDERGSTEYNMALGDNRANSTRDALVKLGIPTNRIRTISYGKEKPFCTAENDQCYQENRRGHFVLDR